MFSDATIFLRKMPVQAVRLSGDDRATFSVVFAVTLAPLAMALAMAIDFSSVSRVRQTLQSAADAAVLAASRLNDADDSRVATALRIFNSQLSPSQLAAASSLFYSSFGVCFVPRRARAAARALVVSLRFKCQ